VLVGHVDWGGARPTQPHPLQAQPISLTLKSVLDVAEYPLQNTDHSGFFTISVGTLPAGTYNWRVKGPKDLANGGSLTLTGDPETQYDMGFMRPGDCNDDNRVSVQDFTILKATFGKQEGDNDYDDRADFNGDKRVTVVDFLQIKLYFGMEGAGPPAP
jgi:hypothetical protein